MISSKEVTAVLNINVKTLTRWHQQGLIPPPVIRTSPSGRGKMGYWDIDVVAKGLQIQRLLKHGYPLSTIAGMTDAEIAIGLAGITIVPSGLNAWDICTEHQDGTLRPLLQVTRVDQRDMTEEVAGYVVERMANGLENALRKVSSSQWFDGVSIAEYLMTIDPHAT